MNQQQSPHIQKKSPQKSIRILLLANSIIIGLLATWIILGNLLATQQEEAMRAELREFSKRFPKEEANSSATQLEQLRSKLGLTVLIGEEKSDPVSPSDTDRKSYESIRKPLNDYLESQISKPNDHIDRVPESIHRYLTIHAKDLSTIRNHVLSSEAPRWGTADFQQTLNPLSPTPSFLNIANLQKILLVDALEANRLGLYQRSFDNLAAAWKINHSFYERPQLISLLVAIIASNLQTGVLRRMNHLPPTWQQQLPEADVRRSLLIVYEGQSFADAESLRTYSPEGKEFWQTTSSILNEIRGGENRYLEPSPVAKIQQVFQQPYFRLVGVNERSRMRGSILELLSNQDCSLDAQAWLEKYPGSLLYSDSNSLAPLYSLQKTYRNSINLELTQKILQIKELVVKSGKAPQKILGMESSKVCPSLRWKYQASSDGTMSISLQNPPKWLIQKGGLPLTYQLSLKDLLKQNSLDKRR
jgi:hypothetical protein